MPRTYHRGSHGRPGHLVTGQADERVTRVDRSATTRGSRGRSLADLAQRDRGLPIRIWISIARWRTYGHAESRMFAGRTIMQHVACLPTCPVVGDVRRRRSPGVLPGWRRARGAGYSCERGVPRDDTSLAHSRALPDRRSWAYNPSSETEP